MFLNGRTAVELDGLRRRLADDPNLEIVDRIERAEITVAIPAPVRPLEPLLEALTVREREVLALVADGLPNREIAAALGISEHTAKFHVNGVMAKLSAGTRTEAVVEAVRRGLVTL